MKNCYYFSLITLAFLLFSAKVYSQACEIQVGPTDLASDVRLEWVNHYASKTLPGEDFAVALALDKSGNIYIAGYCTSLPFSNDYFVAKYDARGNLIWVERYDGGINGDDYACALAVDGSGNVYVTGLSPGDETGYDYATVKYNPNGVKQWAVRYDGPTHTSDYARAIVVDASGNVYVTGKSPGINTDYDYVTVKYNTNGAEQWVARYDGPANAADSARAITVDKTGNVYVTGSSRDPWTGSDYTTLKYDSQGKMMWLARYQGPGKDDGGCATAIALDDSGYVYVTGGSKDGDARTDFDYVTVQYNPDGIQMWAIRYDDQNASDYPAALKISSTGYVYVTGTSSKTYRSKYATVKYNSAGKEIWRATDQGGQAVALGIDASDNVYVTGENQDSGTGTDYTTVKYDSSGVLKWMSRYNGSKNYNACNDYAKALAIDASGFIYVAGYSEGDNTRNDGALVKYNDDGAQQWIARYNGPGNSENSIIDLAVDGSGNVYLVGNESYYYSEISKSGYSKMITYNSVGVERWAKKLGVYTTVFTLDAIGDIYITGSYSHDYRTIKYNKSGEQKWIATYDGPGNSSDYASAITSDINGNIYVTGSSMGNSKNYDYATIKYNSSGGQEWVVRYNGPGDTYYTDQASAIANDPFGNTYVTGTSEGAGTKYDIATIKYNSIGVEQWIARFNGTTNSYDQGYNIATDAAGNVYVIGSSSGLILIKYNSFGVQQWLANEDISQSSSIALDSNGNIYVTGSTYVGGFPNYNYNFITIKYNPEGVRQWLATYDGPANKYDSASDIVLDRSGNVYVTGYSQDKGNLYDIVTVSYDPGGAQRWVSRYNCPNLKPDSNHKIGLDGLGDVYVAGTTAGSGWSVVTTVKYSQNTPPVIIAAHPDSFIANEACRITAMVTDDRGLANVTLSYRKGGATEFTSFTMSDSAGMFHAILPGSAVTSRGLEYFIVAKDLGGLSARFPSAGAVISLSIKVPAPGVISSKSQPGGNAKTAYRLVSFPLDLKDKNPHSVLEDDLGKFDKKKWRFFELDANQIYHEFPGVKEIRPGAGYWLIVKDQGKVLDTGAGTTIITNKRFSIALNPGWNFIGNPFNFSIPISQLTLKTDKPMDIRNYTGSWNNLADSIQAFEGYAIADNTNDLDTLYFDPYLHPAPGHLARVLNAKKDDNFLWSIGIQARCQEALDTDNFAAVAKNASNDWDRLDRPEPPVIGDYVSVSFPHLDWDRPLKRYCLDARPEPLAGAAWEFEVKSNIDDKVSLVFSGLDQIPSSYEAWLIDEAAKISQNLKNSNCYSVAVYADDQPYQMKLLVGSAGFVDAQLNEFRLVPETYELCQNFPNPFNPITTIRFGLPETKKVTLKIYNVLGEEVVTLIDQEEKEAGYYVVIWNGRNQQGQSVANGIYLYRLHAGNYNLTKKMALIK